jgi:hypothetical protein
MLKIIIASIMLVVAMPSYCQAEDECLTHADLIEKYGTRFIKDFGYYKVESLNIQTIMHEYISRYLNENEKDIPQNIHPAIILFIIANEYKELGISPPYITKPAYETLSAKDHLTLANDVAKRFAGNQLKNDMILRIIHDQFDTLLWLSAYDLMKQDFMSEFICE